MQSSNLSWLEVEARYRIADLTAGARTSRRHPRQLFLRFPSAVGPRRVIGLGLVALGERLAGPRPVGRQSAA